MVNIMQRFSTQEKEFKVDLTWKHFSSTSISYTIFMIYRLSMINEVPLWQKEASASPQGIE
jgi:hypothetical protein